MPRNIIKMHRLIEPHIPLWYLIVGLDQLNHSNTQSLPSYSLHLQITKTPK